MSIHYDADYHEAIMAAGSGAALVRWRRQREEIFKRKKSGSLLDVGCSSGAFLGTMKSDAWKLFGIEMESSTARKARAATGAEVFVGDAANAPFKANSFDVVTCSDVLEHVYEPRKFLEKILEWLKPGGIFYTSLPNIDSWEARTLGQYWYGLEVPRHLFHFSPQSLRYLTASVGLQEASIVTLRVSYIERSVRYLGSAAIEKFGMRPVPMAKNSPRSVPARILRKALRVSFIGPLGMAASAMGTGASIEGIFRKPT
jgi:2-polyprenyl-3-methyl-5-hydroxy-6-metoxy-1,4-benzoquinol methylase